MDCNVENTGSYLRKVSVSIPAQRVADAFNDVYRDIRKNARIPGFRKGKAPVGVLERHYKSQAESEVREKLVREALTKAIDENSLDIVSSPKVDFGELTKDKNFEFTAEVEVHPEVEVKKFKGLTTYKVDNEVTDEEINRELEQMREQAAQMVPVMLRDVVQKGDYVQMDYRGTINGEPFAGGSGENALIHIGGEGYLPGFSEGLEGAKVPSTREVHVTFPDDYKPDTLAGQEAIFEVNVKELKARELPALDDDFAKDMGEESLEDLKEKIRKGIAERKEDEALSMRREKVLKSLVEANPFECPPSLIESQARQMVENAAERVAQMMGRRFDLGPEEYGNLLASNMEAAEHQVRSGLLMLQLSEDQKIDVDDNELDAEVEKQIEGAGDSAERVRAYFANPDVRRSMRYQLVERKVVEFLLEHAEEAEPPPPEEHDHAHDHDHEHDHDHDHG